MVGGAELGFGWLWACAQPPSEARASFMALIGGEISRRPRSNSPLNLTGDVRILSPTTEAPHARGRYKCPVHSPPSHPRPVNAFLPWYTHCSLSPHSSDPSSLPTRLTRSSWRLSVLFDVPLLPTRASPCPWSLPGHQQRPRPSWCPVSSLPPCHHPQHDVLSSSSLALLPVH